MLIFTRANFRIHIVWIVVFCAGLAGCLLALPGQFEEGTGRYAGGSSAIGLTAGIAAALIIGFECLLWPRKKLLRSWRIGRVRTWMAAHIWLGLLTLPLVLLHAGVIWGGALGQWLMALYGIVMLSGVFGLAMQNWLPNQMLELSPEETVYSDIEFVAERNLRNADALVSAVCGREGGFAPLAPAPPEAAVAGASRDATLTFERNWAVDLPTDPIPNTDALWSAYHDTIRPHLSQPGGFQSLRDPRQSEVFFQEVRKRTAPAAGAAIGQLEHWCDHRRQFTLQSRLHFWLHSWLALHLPLSIALAILLVWHIFVALKYSGVV